MRTGNWRAVPLEDMVPVQAFEFEALLNVRERKGILPQTEVLDEIARQKRGRARGR